MEIDRCKLPGTQKLILKQNKYDAESHLINENQHEKSIFSQPMSTWCCCCFLALCWFPNYFDT